MFLSDSSVCGCGFVLPLLVLFLFVCFIGIPECHSLSNSLKKVQQQAETTDRGSLAGRPQLVKLASLRIMFFNGESFGLSLYVYQLGILDCQYP